MKHIRAFGHFWWDFVVGDDWRVAAGLAAGLGLTWLLERREVSAWWLLPVTVAVVLAESVWRESRRVGAEPERNPTGADSQVSADESKLRPVWARSDGRPRWRSSGVARRSRYPTGSWPTRPPVGRRGSRRPRPPTASSE